MALMALSESRSWCQCVFVLWERGPRLTSVFGLALRAVVGVRAVGSVCSHADVRCGVRGDRSSSSCYRGFSHTLLIYVCNGSEAPESEHNTPQHSPHSPIPINNSLSFTQYTHTQKPYSIAILLCVQLWYLRNKLVISIYSSELLNSLFSDFFCSFLYLKLVFICILLVFNVFHFIRYFYSKIQFLFLGLFLIWVEV